MSSTTMSTAHTTEYCLHCSGATVQVYCSGTSIQQRTLPNALEVQLPADGNSLALGNSLLRG